jgi:hypothetical protein
MKRPGSDLAPELEAFLTRRKVPRQAPPDLRMRALARARASLAGDVIPPARYPDASPVASFAIAGAAVGAVAARHDRSADPSHVVSPDRVPTAPHVPVTSVGRASSEAPAPAVEWEPPKAPHPARPGAKGDLLTAELDLLQRAHGAYTRRDFSVALTLVGEHARRFPRSQLAEQREALRVRSLAGAGRADEARAAAAAFAARFPRSVLLPRVAEGAESSQR